MHFIFSLFETKQNSDNIILIYLLPTYVSFIDTKEWMLETYYIILSNYTVLGAARMLLLSTSSLSWDVNNYILLHFLVINRSNIIFSKWIIMKEKCEISTIAFITWIYIKCMRVCVWYDGPDFHGSVILR